MSSASGEKCPITELMETQVGKAMPFSISLLLKTCPTRGMRKRRGGRGEVHGGLRCGAPAVSRHFPPTLLAEADRGIDLSGI